MNISARILSAFVFIIFSQAAFSQCDCGSTNPASACTGNSVSYTREGETISFEFSCEGGACRCGQFANDWDYWVAPPTPGGEVTITRMTPEATGNGDNYRNGAQFGPTNMGANQGFDGRFISNRFGHFDAELSLSTPFAVNPAELGRPQTIMKAISGEDLCNREARICLTYLETLTVLNEPPGDVFRPAYFGNNKTMYPASAFDDSILSKLAPVPSTISWQNAYATVQSVHPQHYVENQNYRQGYTATINTQVRDGYDGYYGEQLNRALLKLVEAPPASNPQIKTMVAKGFTQLGIDLWAIHSEGGISNPTTGNYNFESANCGAFTAQGGFNQNRLAPILFANALLGQDWHLALNQTLSTANGKNCFGETGFIVPAELTQEGKGIPLFGNQIGNLGIYGYTEGENCNIIATDFLTDGGYGSCGSPTSYQRCCTHGHWLASAMAIWLTPKVFEDFPENGMHWLEYIDRARTTGVSVGREFGSYSNPNNFEVTGYDTGYDANMFYEYWDIYRECSKQESFCPEGSPPRSNQILRFEQYTAPAPAN